MKSRERKETVTKIEDVVADMWKTKELYSAEMSLTEQRECRRKNFKMSPPDSSAGFDYGYAGDGQS